MRHIILLVLGASTLFAASLPDTSERKDNAIVLEVSKTAQEEDNDSPADSGEEPFEIVVPVARNFSSLDELFKILREDDSKQPRVASGDPPTYVKGTEKNSSEFLIFFADGVVQGGST